MIKVMNSVEIEKKIGELVGHYLIKDYHLTSSLFKDMFVSA